MFYLKILIIFTLNVSKDDFDKKDNHLDEKFTAIWYEGKIFQLNIKHFFSCVVQSEVGNVSRRLRNNVLSPS